MPTRNKKICNFPGCPRLAEAGKQYCSMHSYDKDIRRPDERARYTGKWVKIRAQYLASHPYCEVCFANGVMTIANLVHHIKPLSAGGTNDKDNLQSLCKSCHSRIHAERGDYLSH